MNYWNYLNMMSLNEIIKMLSEQRIYRKVYSPVYKIKFRMEQMILDEYRHVNFNDFFFLFLNELTSKRLIESINYSQKFDRTIIIPFLEIYYNGKQNGGYAGATYDFKKEGKTGINKIVTQVCESIIYENLIKYIDWIYEFNIELLDWNSKLQLNKELFNNYSNIIPTQIKEFNIARQVFQLKDLIEIIAYSKNHYSKSLETKFLNKRNNSVNPTF